MFGPKDIKRLYKDFRSAFRSARDAESASTKAKSPLSLWPHSMRDFLDEQLHSQLEVQSYILDPTQCQDPVQGSAMPQPLPQPCCNKGFFLQHADDRQYSFIAYCS